MNELNRPQVPEDAKLDGLIKRLKQYRGDRSEVTECFNGVRDEAADVITSLRQKELMARAQLCEAQTEAERQTKRAERAEADLAAAREDAGRYRWLKATAPGTLCSIAWRVKLATADEVANDPDLAIDTARGKA